MIKMSEERIMVDERKEVFVLVLMPFDASFKEVYVSGIKPACQQAGALCERIDEMIFTRNILAQIYQKIKEADLIVAEMTGRNPNVFYEAGYARALNKQVIFLTQREEDIPFDLKHYPHIVYGGEINKLKEELLRKVSWVLQHPEETLPVDESNGREINLDELQIEILKTLTDKESTSLFDLDHLAKRLAKMAKPEVVRLSINELETLGFIESKKNFFYVKEYSLTPKGFKYLRDNKLI